MTDETPDPFADNPELEWAETRAMQAIPPADPGSGTPGLGTPDTAGDGLEETVVSQAEDLQRAIANDLKAGQTDQAATAPDHRFDTGMRAAQGLPGMRNDPEPTPPSQGLPGMRPQSGQGAAGATQQPPGGNQVNPQQPNPNPQYPQQGHPQQGHPQQGFQQGPGAMGGPPGPVRPGLAPGVSTNQDDAPRWRQVASGLSLYRLSFALMVLFLPAVIFILALAFANESMDMLKAAFYGGPIAFFLIGIGVSISQLKMSKVPKSAGGSGLLMTAFIGSTIALVAAGLSYFWFMSLIDMERLSHMSLEGFGISVIMIIVLAAGAYLLWTLAFILMLLGWRQVASSLNASKAHSMASTTLVVYGILFGLGVIGGAINDPTSIIARMLSIASLVLSLVFLIWVLLSASALKNAIKARFGNG